MDGYKLNQCRDGGKFIGNKLVLALEPTHTV